MPTLYVTWTARGKNKTSEYSGHKSYLKTVQQSFWGEGRYGVGLQCGVYCTKLGLCVWSFVLHLLKGKTQKYLLFGSAFVLMKPSPLSLSHWISQSLKCSPGWWIHLQSRLSLFVSLLHCAAHKHTVYLPFALSHMLSPPFNCLILHSWKLLEPFPLGTQ